jgi:hypothetical protein
MPSEGPDCAMVPMAHRVRATRLHIERALRMSLGLREPSECGAVNPPTFPELSPSYNSLTRLAGPGCRRIWLFYRILGRRQKRKAQLWQPIDDFEVQLLRTGKAAARLYQESLPCGREPHHHLTLKGPPQIPTIARVMRRMAGGSIERI